MSIKFGVSADPQLALDLEALAAELEKLLGGGEKTWFANIEKGRISAGEDFYNIFLNSPDVKGLRIQRTLHVKHSGGSYIVHDYFTLPEELQNKGLADPVMDFTRKQYQRFKLKLVKVHANIDVGGYAWLRKGFMPNAAESWLQGLLSSQVSHLGYLVNYSKLPSAAEKAAAAENLRLAMRLQELTKGLKRDALQKLFLSPEFSEYKPLFLKTNWYGQATLSKAEVRAAMFKEVKAAKALPPPATAVIRGARGTLVDSSIRHQVLLERLKMAEAREYNTLLAMLRGQVAGVQARLRSSGSELSSLTRGRLNGLLRELDGAQSAALADAQDKLIRRLQMISEYETGFEYSTLSNAVPEGTAITAASAPAAWAAANVTPMSIGGDLLQPWIKEMTRAEVSMINKTILRGWSEGWTNDELEKILNGTKALNFKDGLLPKMASHNSTIIRTAIQHVSSAARMETWKANSDIITKYRWVSTLDSRTSPQCRSLDGEEFEIGKGPLPPIHPNCRSTTVAVLKGKLAALSEGRTRASADGPVDANLTYYEWLKTQDAQFQEDVLGPTRAAMFQSEGMTAEKFARLQLGTAFQPLTLEEIAAKGY